MRKCPNMRVVNFKQPDPGDGRMYPSDVDGLYFIPHRGLLLKVIASDGMGWEHVSVSLSNRCPTWTEMEFVRTCFWRDDETVMQLSVPRSDHINCHPFCLHLWKPTAEGVEIPRPPAWMVGGVVPPEVLQELEAQERTHA